MPVSIVYDADGQIVAAVRLAEGRQGTAIGGEGQNVIVVDDETDLEVLIGEHRVDVTQASLVSPSYRKASS